MDEVAATTDAAPATGAPPGSWTLAVDLGGGTSVAALAYQGRIHPIDEQGRLANQLNSATWVSDDGEILVGRAALDRAAEAPERFEPSSKSLVGEGALLLGSRMVPVADLVGAVLERHLRVARRAAGGAVPTKLRLVHPAGWGALRTGVLRQAAAGVGYADVELVAEPVAAAIHVSQAGLDDGDRIAVYDLGATSCDVAVVERRGATFQLAGPPASGDGCAGDEIDQRIIEYLGQGPMGRHPDWAKLCLPPDSFWRKAALEFKAAVRRAKEALSTSVAAEIDLVGLDRQVQLSKHELEEIARPVVDLTLDVLAVALADARVEASSLAAIQLVGGSSRMPLVADAVWARFGVRPEVQEEPALAGALGAAVGFTAEPVEQRRPFRSELVASLTAVLSGRTASCQAHLELSGDDVTVTLTDTPASDGADQPSVAAKLLAEANLGYRELSLRSVQVLGQPNGFERRYEVDGPEGLEVWFERYLQLDGRWLSVKSPEHARQVADAVTLAPSSPDPPNRFEMRFVAVLPAGWRAYERLQLVRGAAGNLVTAESFAVLLSVTMDAWVAQEVATYRAWAGPSVQGPFLGKFLGGHPAFVLSFSNGVSRSKTQVWTGLVNGRAYRISEIIPEQIQHRVMRRFETLVEPPITLRQASPTGSETAPPTSTMNDFKRRVRDIKLPGK